MQQIHNFRSPTDPEPALRSYVVPIQQKGISIPGSAHFKDFYAKVQGSLLLDKLSMLRGTNQSLSGDFSGACVVLFMIPDPQHQTSGWTSSSRLSARS